MSIDPAWVALSLSQHIGSKTLRALMRQFGQDPRAILQAETADLRRVPGVGPKIARTIQEIDLRQVEQAIARWQAQGILILPPSDSRYPAPLRALDDRPATLFIRGNWRGFEQAVAVVGTREPSLPALDMARHLGYELAQRGYAVVSGLAVGIDTAAHTGALANPQGWTLAVLGSGILNLYPPENLALATAIMQRGALLCEVHPESAVTTPGLVARNRIISGLCDAVIVVETDADGGAMYAARFARDQGRRMYTLDFPASGNRALLQEGAMMLQPDLSNLEL